MQALHFFAFNLLQARDGSYSTNENSLLSSRSIIQSLADELSQNRYIKRYFPVPTPATSSSDEQSLNPIHSETKRLGSTDKMTVVDIVQHRKKAAFQTEVLKNPFFKEKIN